MRLRMIEKYLLIFIIFSFFSVNLLAEENKKVVIAVDPDISLVLDDEIKTYVTDLTVEGWNVEVTYPQYSDSSDFTKLLRSWKHEFDIDGVVLIGSFPYTDDPSLGNLNPFFNRLFGGRVDFWISRIDPELVESKNKIDSVTLIKQYFSKNHNYRKKFKYENRTTVISDSSYVEQIINNSIYLLSPDNTKVVSVSDKDSFLYQNHVSDSLLTEIRLHGNEKCLKADGVTCITATDLIFEFDSKSKLIDLQSCYGGSPNIGNIASALLFSAKSKVLSVLARPGLAWTVDTLVDRNCSSSEQTAGDVFISHNLSWFHIYEKMASYLHYYLLFNSYDSRILLGDGTIQLTH